MYRVRAAMVGLSMLGYGAPAAASPWTLPRGQLVLSSTFDIQYAAALAEPASEPGHQIGVERSEQQTDRASGHHVRGVVRSKPQTRCGDNETDTRQGREQCGARSKPEKQGEGSGICGVDRRETKTAIPVGDEHRFRFPRTTASDDTLDQFGDGLGHQQKAERFETEAELDAHEKERQNKISGRLAELGREPCPTRASHRVPAGRPAKEASVERPEGAEPSPVGRGLREGGATGGLVFAVERRRWNPQSVRRPHLDPSRKSLGGFLRLLRHRGQKCRLPTGPREEEGPNKVHPMMGQQRMQRDGPGRTRP